MSGLMGSDIFSGDPFASAGGVGIPYGDPAGMRFLAAMLRGNAQTAATIPHDLVGKVDGADAQGDFIDRFRAQMGEVARGGDTVGGRLNALADYLVREAGQLEADIRAARQKAAELAAQKARDAKKKK